MTTSTFVVDRSERGKLALTGPEAKDFLQGQVTNDILGLTPGHGCYAAFLTHKGKMLGDMRVFDLGDELLLDCERVALQELFNMIRRYKLGRDLELHKRTLELGLLSVIGPGAPELAGPDEHDNARAQLGGADVDRRAHRRRHRPVLRRGRQGRRARRARLPRRDRGGGRDRARRARPPALRRRPRRQRDPPGGRASTSARCRSPRAVTSARRRSRGCYYRGKPNRRLLGLRLSEPVEPGTELKLGEKVVGKLGSVVVSPDHGPIALALVRREANPGDTVDLAGSTALIVDVPFAR